MGNFAIFLSLLLVIAAALRVDFFFTILYLFFIVYLLTRFWIRRAMANLCVRRQFVNRAFPGEQVTVNLVVQNTGWLPLPWLATHESLPVQLIAPAFHREVLSLGPREQKTLRYTLDCRRRGYYPIGPLTMQTGDLLGIVGPVAAQQPAEHLIIYPRVVSLKSLGLPTHSPLAALPARSPLFEDPARVRGVRDYQPGDSLRRIHWTATASSGRLLVKQYQPAIARETLIGLDLEVEDYDLRQRYVAAELAIVVAASIAHHIIVQEKLPVGLATEARDPLLDRPVQFSLPPRRERAHLMSLLEVLARVEVASATSFPDLLRRESLHLAWGATVVVITGRESPALLDTLVYLKRAGFAVALILVRAHRPSTDLQAGANLIGAPIYPVWAETDLEAWR